MVSPHVMYVDFVDIANVGLGVSAFGLMNTAVDITGGFAAISFGCTLTVVLRCALSLPWVGHSACDRSSSKASRQELNKGRDSVGVLHLVIRP
jgi:hypothetical protein